VTSTGGRPGTRDDPRLDDMPSALNVREMMPEARGWALPELRLRSCLGFRLTRRRCLTLLGAWGGSGGWWGNAKKQGSLRKDADEGKLIKQGCFPPQRTQGPATVPSLPRLQVDVKFTASVRRAALGLIRCGSRIRTEQPGCGRRLRWRSGSRVDSKQVVWRKRPQYRRACLDANTANEAGVEVPGKQD
jgi:hypothetical protein